MKKPPAPPSRRARRAPQPNQASPAPSDLWWLDEPIRPVRGGRYAPAFNPRLSWFIDRLPGRARTLILKAARGELRALSELACPFCSRCARGRRCADYSQWCKRVIRSGRVERLYEHFPPARTLREFIALPAQAVIMQHRYGYKTHMALCRALRANGVTGPLFGTDESRLLPRYPYLPATP